VQVFRGRIIAIALILGAVTAALVYITLSQQAPKKQINQVKMVVSARDISRGSVLDATMLETHTVLETQAPHGVANSTDFVIGKVAVENMPAGAPVLTSSLAVKDRLSQSIEHFMRAVTVNVDTESGVGGFLKPGDRVDIVGTFNLNQGSISKTVLQNIELLALGGDFGNPPPAAPNGGMIGGQQKPSTVANPVPYVTVSVSSADAERLILAESKGKLRLVLRRSDDVAMVHTKGVTGRQILEGIPSDSVQKVDRITGKSLVTVSRPFKAPKITDFLKGIPPLGITPPPTQEKKVQVIKGSSVEEVSVPN
jgi:pilus assembly protein CpaB